MAVSSRIRMYSSGPDSVTFQYGQAYIKYEDQGETIVDRNGIAHQIKPLGIGRYPSYLKINLLNQELFLRNQQNTLSSLEWLELHFRARSELVLFIENQTLDATGQQLIINRAYKVQLTAFPQEGLTSFSLLQNDANLSEFHFTIHEDGMFAEFDQLSTYQPFEPHRPGSVQ